MAVNNSEGLSPTIRAQLGTGWGRALPGAYGFDNGINAITTGTTVANFNKAALTGDFCIETWFKIAAFDGTNERSFFVLFNQLSLAGAYNTNRVALFSTNTQLVLGDMAINTKHHLLVNITATGLNNYTCTAYINNVMAGTISITVALYNSFILGRSYNPFYPAYTNGFTTGNMLDEVRVYKKNLSQGERFLAYNNGLGDNPPTTEHLICWYNFQQIETLDFSLLQDNSNIQQGIKDLSNQASHLPFTDASKLIPF